jgi:hypothetical protein
MQANDESGNRTAINEVKNLLTTLVKSQEEGDVQKFASCFANDDEVVNIGTDLDEYWTDWHSFQEWMQYAIKLRREYKISEKDTRIKISKDGTVAWYSQLIDTCFETKGDPVRLEGFRHTGVVEFRSNKWVIVQSHISIPFTLSTTPDDLDYHSTSSFHLNH